MANRLFTYGTLTDPKVQKRVWGRLTPGIADVLPGYRKSEIRIEGDVYPLIVADAARKVRGSVIEVTDEELRKIDEYESDAYRRVEVVLESGMPAWVYTKN